MKTFPYPAQALLDPLDIGAVKRLMRLKVLTPEGALDYEGLENIATFIGCDMHDILSIHEFETDRMLALLNSFSDCETRFLFLCLIYDEICADIPHQLQTLATHRPALSEFMVMFVNTIEDITESNNPSKCDELLVAAVKAEIARYNLENMKAEI